MKITVMIPTMNLKLCQGCLDSIRENSTTDPEVIVWDNTISNIGIPAAYKRLAATAKNEVLFPSDDDYRFAPGWDTALLASMLNGYEACGGPFFSRAPIMIENLGGNPNTIEQDFGTVDNFDVKGFNAFTNYLVDGTNAGLIHTMSKYNPNQPAAVMKECWDKLGGWNCDYFPGWGSDPDFTYRLQQLCGAKEIQIAPGSYFYHFVSSTAKTMPNDGQARAVSHATFSQKHGITIAEFNNRFRAEANET